MAAAIWLMLVRHTLLRVVIRERVAEHALDDPLAGGAISASYATDTGA